MFGLWFLLERLRDEADAALNDQGRAFAELSELSVRRNAGQLSEADYIEQETRLLQRLSAMREREDAQYDVDVVEEHA